MMTVIAIQADRFELLRCSCPECRILDRRHPGEGWQLSLFPISSIERGLFELVDRKRGIPK